MSRSFRHEWATALTAATSPATSTCRLVGLVLVDFYVNSETGLAWPSATTLGERTGLNEKSARRALHELHTLGFLSIAKRGRTITWLIVIPAGRTESPMSHRAEGPTSAARPRTLTSATSDSVSRTSGTAPDEPSKRVEEPGSSDTSPPLTAAAGTDEQAQCPACTERFGTAWERSHHFAHAHGSVPTKLPTGFTIGLRLEPDERLSDDDDGACLECDTVLVPRLVICSDHWTSTYCVACAVACGYVLATTTCVWCGDRQPCTWQGPGDNDHPGWYCADEGACLARRPEVRA